MADPSNRLVYGVTAYAGSATVAGFIQAANGSLKSLYGPGGCVRRQTGPARVRRQCSKARALRRPLDLAMAPDGRNLYVLTHGSEPVNDGGVVTLRRHANGTIKQPAGVAGCITQQARAGCAPGRSMDQGRRLAMSLDGHSLYVTSQTGGVAVLTRTVATGRLQQLDGTDGCVLSAEKPVGTSCERVAVPNAVPVDLVVSPDGAFVYVLMARRKTGAVAVYARSVTNGKLTLAGCVAEAGGTAPCGAVHGLAGASSIAISPDGRSVYVGAHYYKDGGNLTTFTRDATSGALAQGAGADGCLSPVPAADCGQGPGFVRPTSVAVSHDGATVYVAYANDTEGTGDGSVLAAFTRDSSSGVLAYQGCVAPRRPGCERARGVYGFTRVTISVDGRYMYLGGRNGLGIFRP